jgi:hypothetical protein
VTKPAPAITAICVSLYEVGAAYVRFAVDHRALTADAVALEAPQGCRQRPDGADTSLNGGVAVSGDAAREQKLPAGSCID